MTLITSLLTFATDEETRKLYRIGRGEQGVLLVRITLTTFVLIGGS